MIERGELLLDDPVDYEYLNLKSTPLDCQVGMPQSQRVATLSTWSEYTLEYLENLQHLVFREASLHTQIRKQRVASSVSI